LAIEIIVHPGVDSAFIAWRAPFIDQCRDFALYRKVKRGPGSAASPNTTSSPDAQGFAVEVVASWVGFADGPDVEPGTRKPTTEWPIQKYLWSDFMVNPGDEVAEWICCPAFLLQFFQFAYSHETFVLAIPKPVPLYFFLLGHRPRYVNLPSFHVDNPGITHSYGILPSSGGAIGSLRKAASSSACRPVMSVLRVSGWL